MLHARWLRGVHWKSKCALQESEGSNNAFAYVKGFVHIEHNLTNEEMGGPFVHIEHNLRASHFLSAQHCEPAPSGKMRISSESVIRTCNKELKLPSRVVSQMRPIILSLASIAVLDSSENSQRIISEAFGTAA